MRAQRTAVTLFPFRALAKEGVISLIRMERYLAQVRKPAHTSFRSGV